MDVRFIFVDMLRRLIIQEVSKGGENVLYTDWPLWGAYKPPNCGHIYLSDMSLIPEIYRHFSSMKDLDLLEICAPLQAPKRKSMIYIRSMCSGLGFHRIALALCVTGHFPGRHARYVATFVWHRPRLSCMDCLWYRLTLLLASLCRLPVRCPSRL